METWFNGKKQKEAWIQGKKCKEIWKGGKKIFEASLSFVAKWKLKSDFLDTSGNNLTLTTYPNPTSFGSEGAVFTGNNCLYRGLNPLFSLTSDGFSFGCRVKFNDVSGIQGIFGKTILLNTPDRWGIYLENGILYSYFQRGGVKASTITTPISNYNDGNFHNIVCVQDVSTNTFKTYIDNVLIGSTPLDSLVLTSTRNTLIFIGAYGNANGQGPSYFSKSEIAKCFIIRQALTSSEVIDIFNKI